MEGNKMNRFTMGCMVRMLLAMGIAGFISGCGSSSGGGGGETPPATLVAKIDSPSGPVSISAGQAVNFNGSATGGTAPYEYSWNFGDGSDDSELEDPGDKTFETVGTFTVKLTVTDSADREAEKTITITVTERDTNPTGAITLPAGSTTIIAGQTVRFSGSASGGNAPLSFLWNFDGGAANSTVLNPGNVVFLNPGIYDVSFSVTDTDSDMADGGTVTVTVLADTQPENNIFTPAGNVVIVAGQSVNFSGTASGGNSPLAYSWDFGGGATNSSVLNPGNVTFATAGTYTVTFSATDVDGDRVSKTRTVTVAADTRPTVAISSPSANTTLIAGQSVNFTATATGGNGTLTYLWNFNGGTTNSTVLNPGNVTFATAGTYNVTDRKSVV
jgi:PKD repeat protein